MDALSTRARTPLPPRGPDGGAAVDAAHGLLAALVERDTGAASGLLADEACAWWTHRGHLSTVEGSDRIARALVALLDGEPPTRLRVQQNTSSSALVSALVGDDLAWTLELCVGDGHIVAAFVRGATLPS
jgi:hypothetical protein